MRGHDRAADRQSETETVFAKRHERFEYALELPIWNPRTTIRHRQLDEAIVGRRREHKLPDRRVRRVHRVARVQHEIEHDLLQLHTIAQHGRDRRRERALHGHAPRCELTVGKIDHFANDFAEIDRLARGLSSP